MVYTYVKCIKLYKVCVSFVKMCSTVPHLLLLIMATIHAHTINTLIDTYLICEIQVLKKEKSCCKGFHQNFILQISDYTVIIQPHHKQLCYACALFLLSTNGTLVHYLLIQIFPSAPATVWPSAPSNQQVHSPVHVFCFSHLLIQQNGYI